MDPHVLSRALECLKALDLDVGADVAEVKQAYRLQARVWNPERLRHDARLRAIAERKHSDIKRSHDWLIQNLEVVRELALSRDGADAEGEDRSKRARGITVWMGRTLRANGISLAIATNGALYILLVGLLVYNIYSVYSATPESLIGPLGAVTAREAPSESRPESGRAPNQDPVRSDDRTQAPVVADDRPVRMSEPRSQPRARTAESGSNSAAPTTVQVGVSKVDVSRLLGAPNSIERRTSRREEIWHYSTISITFFAVTDLVIDIGPPAAKDDRPRESQNVVSETWSIGSLKDDVARMQGAPTSIERLRVAGQEIWHFGESTVTFSTETDRVTAWDDSGGILRVSPSATPE